MKTELITSFSRALHQRRYSYEVRFTQSKNKYHRFQYWSYVIQIWSSAKPSNLRTIFGKLSVLPG